MNLIKIVTRLHKKRKESASKTRHIISTRSQQPLKQSYKTSRYHLASQELTFQALDPSISAADLLVQNYNVPPFYTFKMCVYQNVSFSCGHTNLFLTNQCTSGELRQYIPSFIYNIFSDDKTTICQRLVIGTTYVSWACHICRGGKICDTCISELEAEMPPPRTIFDQEQNGNKVEMSWRRRGEGIGCGRCLDPAEDVGFKARWSQLLKQNAD